MVIDEVMFMALAGHKFAQMPHNVHDDISVMYSLFSLFSSIIPWGQTPTQTSSEQPEHLSLSKEITKRDLSMSNQQLNKPLGYIFCAQEIL